MHKFFFYLGFLFIFQTSFSQQINTEFSGDFQDVSFEEFVLFLEQNLSIKFYYKSEWVKDVKVNLSGENLDLRKTLTSILKSSSINYYINQDSNVILYKGLKITETLPYYQSVNTTFAKSDENSDAKITQSEKKYIEGKKVAALKLISVGNKQNSNNSKTYVVNGRIIDNSTGEPLVGATVFIEELELGAATDLDGYFNLPVKPGKYLVAANSLSMGEKKFYLDVFSNGSVTIPLEKEMVNINEVKVTAARADNVRGLQMGYERISTKSMKEIPAVLGEKDLLKVAQMLPGVQSAGEGASGLNVRGGTADQNLFYINKLPVYNTSHLFGFFTAFSPDIVNAFTLYKSNIPAKFGGRVSSVFDITTRQGNKKEFFGKGGISPITGHIALEGPIIKDKSTIVFSYRGSYSDWLLSQMNDINLKNSDAAFYDLSGVINTEINDKNLVKIFTYKSYDRFSLSSTDDYNYSNTGGTASWKHIFSSSLSADFSAIVSQYQFGHNSKSNPSEAFRNEYQLSHNEAKTDFLYVTDKNHRILFGGSGIFYRLNRGSVNPYNEESNRIAVELGVEKGIEGAFYASDEFSLSTRFTLLAGIRYSYYAMLGPTGTNEYFANSPIDKNNIKEKLNFENNQLVKFYSGPEPRIAFNYLLGTNSSLKASYNRVRQYIFMLSNTIAISPTDQWKLADYHIKPPVSDQISLGYYQDFPDIGLVTSAEIYKKWTKNIVEYKDGVDFISDVPTEMLLLQGKQESYGLELMVKKRTGKFTGWVSYSYSNSMIQVKSSLPTEQINYGKKYPSNFDRPHSISFVSNLRSNRRLSLSTNVVYSTGRPITYPVASYFTEGQEILHYSERNAYRIPDYFRIDLSVNLEGNLLSKKWIHSFWMLNVYNLTGRRNAYSVYFEAKEGKMQGYKLSVFGQPIITLSWNFKFGNYTSE